MIRVNTEWCSRGLKYSPVWYFPLSTPQISTTIAEPFGMGVPWAPASCSVDMTREGPGFFSPEVAVESVESAFWWLSDEEDCAHI